MIRFVNLSRDINSNYVFNSLLEKMTRNKKSSRKICENAIGKIFQKLKKRIFVNLEKNMTVIVNGMIFEISKKEFVHRLLFLFPEDAFYS